MLWLSYYKLYLGNSYLTFPSILRPADGCSDGAEWNADSSVLSKPWALQDPVFYLVGLWAKLMGHIHIHHNVRTLHIYKRVIFGIPICMVSVRIGSSYWARCLIWCFPLSILHMKDLLFNKHLYLKSWIAFQAFLAMSSDCSFVYFTARICKYPWCIFTMKWKITRILLLPFSSASS